MANIRSKMLQSRRVGATLNGMGNTDEWYGYGGYTDPQPTTLPGPSFNDLLSLGVSLFNQPQSQPAQQVVYTQAPSAGMDKKTMILLGGAALAAVFILTMPKR